MNRKRVPTQIETAVLTKSARRCTLCFFLSGDLIERHGQVAHLDQDPSNYAEDNLAFMCLVHHSLYDSRTSQHKNYTIDEVKAGRTKLYEAIARQEHCTPGVSPPEPRPKLQVAPPEISAVGYDLLTPEPKTLPTTRLRYGGVHRRSLYLGQSLSAVVLDIKNERGRKTIETADNVRANVTFRDADGKELTKVFRGLWWIDVFHASETTKIPPEDQAQLAVLYSNCDSPGWLIWRPYPFDVDVDVLKKLHYCSQIDVEVFVSNESEPQLRLSFSIDPQNQSLGMLPNIQLLDKT